MRTRSSIRIKSSIRASISLSSTRKGYGSGVWIKGMDHAVSWGMDQGMDRGVWIVCGSGALIHTLYFESYPYIYIYIPLPILGRSFSTPGFEAHKASH